MVEKPAALIKPTHVITLDRRRVTVTQVLPSEDGWVQISATYRVRKKTSISTVGMTRRFTTGHLLRVHNWSTVPQE